jgi:hypothetical protein
MMEATSAGAVASGPEAGQLRVDGLVEGIDQAAAHGRDPARLAVRR